VRSLSGLRPERPGYRVEAGFKRRAELTVTKDGLTTGGRSALPRAGVKKLVQSAESQ